MPILTEAERVGTSIASGKYALERVLGRGGMGTVFEATHTWTGRRVAIKLLRHDLAANEEASLRYLQEARAATAIDHPNVVEVLDMGRDDDFTVYLVFELLDGESLADRVERKGRLTSDETGRLLLPILDALGRAHQLGIVHRDLKPENVFLQLDGEGLTLPKLLDFGIARVENGTTGETRPGVVSGTPEYMSPEHASGQRVGPASDVWSMGIVMFECLTGYRPFEGDTAVAVLMALTTHPVPSLRECSHVPEAIADVVDRCLVREIDQRIPDGSALRDELASALGVVCLPGRSRSTPPRILSPSDASSRVSLEPPAFAPGTPNVREWRTSSPPRRANSSGSAPVAPRASDPPAVVGRVSRDAETLDPIPTAQTTGTFRRISIAGVAALVALALGAFLIGRSSGAAHTASTERPAPASSGAGVPTPSGSAPAPVGVDTIAPHTTTPSAAAPVVDVAASRGDDAPRATERARGDRSTRESSGDAPAASERRAASRARSNAPSRGANGSLILD